MVVGRFIITLTTLCFCLAGCHGYPKRVSPIENFNATKFMGTWYEIARLDHSFERGLSRVSATYRLENDQIKIVNRGYSEKQKKWKVATGVAVFAKEQDQGYLHVSFFGPFSSTYLIFERGANYEYAFVCGPTTNYLWLLSRKQTGNEELIKTFRQQALSKGFAADELIIVNHQ